MDNDDTPGIWTLTAGEAEPPADIREAAHGLREMYVALRDARFTDAEACRIIAYTIRGDA